MDVMILSCSFRFPRALRVDTIEGRVTVMRCRRFQDRLLSCGILGGPLFVGTFGALGATRDPYEVRRDAVSLLAVGRRGWMQRANFVVVGALYAAAAAGLAGQPSRIVGSRASPVLLAGAGLGLIGSGVFVTDAGGERADGAANEEQLPSRAGVLHDLCALPIFLGIPVAAALSGQGFARHGDGVWARYSRGSAVVMAVSFALFSAAFGGTRRLVTWGGVLQRVSIVSGFGWVSALCFRCRRAPASRN